MPGLAACRRTARLSFCWMCSDSSLSESSALPDPVSASSASPSLSCCCSLCSICNICCLSAWDACKLCSCSVVLSLQQASEQWGLAGCCMLQPSKAGWGLTCKSFPYIGFRASCSSLANNTACCILGKHIVTIVVDSCTIHVWFFRVICQGARFCKVALHFANGFLTTLGGHLLLCKPAVHC